MSTQILDKDVKGLAESILCYNCRVSELSIDELRAVRQYLRERIKSIDKQSEDDSLGYKSLERLADERYKMSRTLPEIEDTLICRQRRNHDYSSLAYNGGGIYMDVSTKGITHRTGKSGKVSLRGVSI